MDFGIGVTTRGPRATPDELVAMAQHAEALGFGYMSVSDHIVIPRSIDSRYPYSESGAFGGGEECLEQLTLIAFLAAATSRIRLLTSVMVLPHRNPVHTAKILATIDVLSGGRLIVGCGVGWMREEFEALGAPPYEHRGSVGNEYLRAFKELWTSDDPVFDGEYCSFSDIGFEPKPVQKPHPPLWIGGESPPALRRAGTLGDAWYPIGNNPVFPVGSMDQLKASIDIVRRHCEEAGRDAAEMDFAYSAGWYDDRQAEKLPDGSRRAFTGEPEQVAKDIRDFNQAGVQHFSLGLQGADQNETGERMERFAERVKPLIES